MSFGVAQTGQLEKANDNTEGQFHIYSVCEAQQKKAVEASQKQLTPWYRRIFH